MLRAFLDTLPGQPGFMGAELLVSPAQPDLALVASRWTAELPPRTAPNGARSWMFTVLDSRP